MTTCMDCHQEIEEDYYYLIYIEKVVIDIREEFPIKGGSRCIQCNIKRLSEFLKTIGGK